MQFRERGRRLECLRSWYDRDAKRMRQTLVGSMKAWERVIPTELGEALTDEERLALEALLQEKEQKNVERQRYWAFKSAAERIREVTDALENHSGDITKEKAAAIHQEASRLLRVLRKAGFPRKAVR